MAKKRPIKVGAVSFDKATDATEWIQKVIDSYPNGQFVSEEHTVFFKDLLELHPSRDEKIGVGVKGFVIDQNPMFPNRTVFIIRNDDKPCDFSWRKCLNGEQQETLHRQAMRVAIVPQILAFKNRVLASGIQYCEISGLRLNSENCAVDHVAPLTFNVVVDEWLKASGLPLEAVQISPTRDLQYNRSMTNQVQVASWFQYHQTNAKLRLLSHEAHRALPKHKYKK